MTVLWKLEEINRGAGGGEVWSFGAGFGFIMSDSGTEMICGSVLWPWRGSGRVCIHRYYSGVSESGPKQAFDIGSKPQTWYFTLFFCIQHEFICSILLFSSFIKHKSFVHVDYAVICGCLDRRFCFSCAGGKTTSSLAIFTRLTVSVF